MIIKLIDNNEKVTKQSIDSSSIIIGRGSSCDIILLSDFLSRQHLQVIISEGEIFIKDLTLSNWIIYNDRTLPKGELIKYSDQYELELPGDLKVSITTGLSDSHQENLKNLSLDLDGAKKKNTKRYNTTVRSKYKKVVDTKKEENNFFAVLIVVLMIGYIVYGHYNNKKQDKKPTAEISKDQLLLDTKE